MNDLCFASSLRVFSTATHLLDTLYYQRMLCVHVFSCGLANASLHSTMLAHMHTRTGVCMREYHTRHSQSRA